MKSIKQLNEEYVLTLRPIIVRHAQHVGYGAKE
jgi:hypothetical protein